MSGKAVAMLSVLSGVLAFLDQHAGAISALSTVVLVIITAWYVRLTGKLVVVNQNQLDQSKKAEADARRSEAQSRQQAIMDLFRIAHRLRSVLANLPRDKQRAEQIRRVTMWPETDVEILESLASSLGRPFDLNLLTIIPALRSIREKACEVQAVNRFTCGSRKIDHPEISGVISIVIDGIESARRQR